MNWAHLQQLYLITAARLYICEIKIWKCHLLLYVNDGWCIKWNYRHQSLINSVVKSQGYTCEALMLRCIVLCTSTRGNGQYTCAEGRCNYYKFSLFTKSVGIYIPYVGTFDKTNKNTTKTFRKLFNLMINETSYRSSLFIIYLSGKLE